MAKIEIAEPTRIVMTVKPDLVYQNKAPVNGRKVLASDIVATQNYVKQSTTAYLSNFQRTFVDRVEAPNDTTLVWHMKTPYAYTFSATGFAEPSSQSIIPKELLDILETAPAIGSGPFELVDHTFGVRYQYKKFENFREAKNGMPYFATRETYSIVDPVAQEAALRSGRISEWTPSAAIVDRVLGELDKTKYANSQFLATGQTSINAMMNSAMGGARPWNKRCGFREAVYRLLNKDQVATLVYGGKAVVTTTPLHANVEQYLMDAKTAEPCYYKRDVAKAKQLLSAMNYDTGKEWEGLVSATNAINTTFAEVVSSQMAEGGASRCIDSPMPQAERGIRGQANGAGPVRVRGQRSARRRHAQAGPPAPHER